MMVTMEDSCLFYKKGQCQYLPAFFNALAGCARDCEMEERRGGGDGGRIVWCLGWVGGI